MNRLPKYKQLNAMDCGPSCLKMICKYYGKHISIETIRTLCCITNEGVSLYGLKHAAKVLRFDADGIRSSIAGLINLFKSPCILHWNHNHYVVLYKIDFSRKLQDYTFTIGDPATGRISKLQYEDFCYCWANEIGEEGLFLLIDKTERFDNFKDEGSKNYRSKIFSELIRYTLPYKQSIVLAVLAVLIASIIQLLLPILTQQIVDIGITNKDIRLIQMILLGMFALEIGNACCGFIRSWVLLKVGIGINVTLITNYLARLMALPISFFDTKFAGDIVQRINDHYRIQYFLTDNCIDTIFAIVTSYILGFVMIYYNYSVALIFFIGSVLYIFWVLAFLNLRNKVDAKMFTINSKNQNSIMQLIYGMQEIKLNGCEKKRLEQWTDIQMSLKECSLKSLKINQCQQTGGILINQIKNLVITSFVAILVIRNEISFGVMLSMQYIVGMLNGPVNQMVNSIRQYQDAGLSLSRLSDVYEKEAEDNNLQRYIVNSEDIVFSNVSFKYDKLEDKNILSDINITIPKGKRTAIVDLSGSGKTTLLKLILGFYNVDKGSITIGGININSLNKKEWRKRCGVVMQDGYIFSDTIRNNIIMAGKNDEKKIIEVCRIANIIEYINKQPLGFETQIGNDGKGLSIGQKQRILIARALYKNPLYIFLDEATNSLDAANEKEISNEIENFT